MLSEDKELLSDCIVLLNNITCQRNVIIYALNSYCWTKHLAFIIVVFKSNDVFFINDKINISINGKINIDEMCFPNTKSFIHFIR